MINFSCYLIQKAFVKGIILVVVLLPFEQVLAQEDQIVLKQAQIAKGEYLFRASGCQTCHTAEEDKFLAGGKAFRIKNQGIVYSSNITSDKETGIGNYTDEEFIRALQDGVGHKDKHLYPVMPYSAYSLMSTDEILAIKAYLDQQPAIKNKVHQEDMVFPYNMRWAIRAWNWKNDTEGHFQSNPDKSAQWNRGKFLVEGPGHCAYCHSPKDWSNGRASTNDYSGSTYNGWIAYNISSDGDTGIGSWSDKDLQQYLSKGYVEGHGAAVGPMAEIINTSLSQLSQKDIRAIVIYLRSLPAKEKGEGAANISPTDLENAEPSRSHGSHLFAALCASCHQQNGQGRQGEYESLWGSKTVTLTKGTNLIRVILEGSELKDSKLGIFPMPGFKDGYSDQDIADIANYVIAHFGNRNGHVTAKQVKQERAQLKLQ
ncbi:c-type cytochrome [Commensalibacter papalotli (ex Servin-Garciduenas et al. 2014)]|uniref:Gluconate 2-dehydrogenase (Acceptor) n=1 Tax=Commensalibacter papalotli (ex Servin-Garciduenas et al. 2014) TaxID=1208583 RepID=W7DWI2_9PROT|nr:c-type cytochrome [Commensalibacter papalotli (ex Servin-Garciduenas et al. 2014)]EUK18578.1 gluconate 2-dehydrogenase (acceptor) [Commensalibacter papalotli (ex Servin-Garciduenas et al. 2014)]